ncbi:hypothetical protein MBLNU230_g5539t1 [Neophaeotheca triangularis]
MASPAGSGFDAIMAALAHRHLTHEGATKIQNPPFPIPIDLSSEAMTRDMAHNPDDWKYTLRSNFEASRDQKLAISRAIWFRGLDERHSFQLSHLRTRLNLAAAKFFNQVPSPSDEAYIAAIVERVRNPGNFQKREHFIRLWHKGEVELMVRTEGEEKALYQKLKHCKERVVATSWTQKMHFMEWMKKQQLQAHEAGTTFAKGVVRVLQVMEHCPREMRGVRDEWLKLLVDGKEVAVEVLEEEGLRPYAWGYDNTRRA